MIRVQYVTIESDSAEVVATVLRALSILPTAVSPQFGELLTQEAPKRPVRPTAPSAPPPPRAERAPAPTRRAVEKTSSSRAPRVSNATASDVIKAAFERDENASLTALAAQLYGAGDGRGVQKVKWNIAALVGKGELERLGATSWRIPKAKARAVETLDPDDSDGDDEDDEDDEDDDSDE